MRTWISRTGWQTARRGAQVNSEAGSEEHLGAQAEGLYHRIAQLETALQAVRASEELLKDTIENANDIIYSHDFQGNLISVNAAGLRLYEYTPDEISSLNITRLIDPEYLPIARQLIRRHLERRALHSRPYELLTYSKTGKPVWVEVSMRLLEQDGRPVAMQGIARDITQRKQIEEAMRQRAAQLEALRQIGLELTAELNLDRLLQSIVARAVELLGGNSGGIYLYRPQDDALVWVTAYGDDPAPIGTVLRRGEGMAGKILESGRWLIVDDYREWNGKAEIYRDYPYVAVVSVPVSYGDEFLGVLDVTAEKPGAFTPADAELLNLFATQAAIAIRNARALAAAEQERRRAQALAQATAALTSTLELEPLLQNILTAALQAIPVANKGSILLLEAETGRLIVRATAGYSDPRIQGLEFPAGKGYSARAIQTGRPCLISDAMEPSICYEGDIEEIRAVRSAVVVPMRYHSQIIGVLSLDNDQRKDAFSQQDLELIETFASQAAVAVEHARLYQRACQHAEELKGALARLRQVDEMKDRFIQNVSHELRSPLALIRGYAELLHGGELGDLRPEQREPVEVITRRARMLSDLVEDITLILLAESRPLKKEPVAIDDLVRAAVQDFQVAATEAGLTLHCSIRGALSPVQGEPVYLRRVLDNLIANAIKFTPAGGQVFVRACQQGQAVLLQVADTGVGIPPEQQALVFERFYRGSSPRRAGGIGLGLAMVKEIVELHGGSVELESQPNQGSTFTVRLPV